MQVYNGGEFLRESIDSILNQSFQNFEFIIINNGSNKETLGLIKSYSKKNKRIILKSISYPNVQKALNIGLKTARGKYIARIDGDDISLKNRLKIQVNYLENHPEIFLVGSSAKIVDEEGKNMGIFKKYDNPIKLKKRLEKSNLFIHPSIMFRNLQNLYYREKFRCLEDYDFYLRLLSEGKRLTNIPEILLKYRIRKDSFVSTKSNQIYFFEKAKEFYKQRKEYGKDDYENLIVPLIEQKQEDFQRRYLRTEILSEFQDNQMKKVRKDIKDYFSRYGFSKRLIIYYFISFFPRRIIFWIRQNLD